MNRAPYGSKARELIRSAEMVEIIAREQNAYFVLAFLMDSGYCRAEILEIMNHLPQVIVSRET